MDSLDVQVATAVLEVGEQPPGFVLASAVGVNTVRIDGTSSVAELPYVNPVTSGDRALLARLDDGAYVIVGPVNQP